MTKPVARHLDALSVPSPTSCEIAVVLLHRGGPQSKDEILPFYERLWSDSAVAPRGKSGRADPKAAVADAADALQRSYGLIGARSPVNDLVLGQARALENVLNGKPLQAAVASGRYRVFAAFSDGGRNLDEIVAAIAASGAKRVVAIPLYPHFAHALGGACAVAFESAAKAARLAAPRAVIASFHDDAGYRATLLEKTNSAFDLIPPDLRANAYLVFSVHSPAKGQERTEDRFLAQTDETATWLMRQLGFDETRCAVGYQGFGGPGGVLEPIVHQLGIDVAKRGHPAVVVVALSYVTDGFETLHDLDIEFYTAVRNSGAKQARRAPSQNAAAMFIQALARLVAASAR
jgi:protoporphyrin/coproporphyrin ferrochelatase